MAAVPLKPRYGPTLAGLLAPRFARLSPAGRWTVCVLAGGLLAAMAATAVLWPRAADFSRSGPGGFDLHYSRALHRVAPEPGGLLKVVQTRHGGFVQSLAVAPLRLPAYEGDPAGELPVYATLYVQRLRARLSGFRLLSEGKARVNGTPAYTVLYTARRDGRRIDGHDVLLVYDSAGHREGVTVQMMATKSAHVGGALGLGINGPLGDALQSVTLNPS